MTFEGQYLTYLEYKSLVEGEGGSAMAEMPFNVLEFEARKQIDLKTQKRLVGIEQIPNEVKLCDYHLIERIKSYNESINSASESNGNIASESTDGYSISYNSINATQIKDVVGSENNELNNIIMNDLYGVIVNGEHVIYNGVK